MNRNRSFGILILLLTASPVLGQLNPLIWKIEAEAYQAEGNGVSPQMRQFLQTDDGLMLMVNTTGILSFDGRLWNMLPGTVGKRFRLAKSPEGIIYACHNQDIGWLAQNRFGEYEFTSLNANLPEDNANLAIFQIVATQNQVHFISVEYLYTWDLNLERLMVRKMPGEILIACAIHQQQDLALILQEGVVQLEQGELSWLYEGDMPEFSEIRAVEIDDQAKEVPVFYLFSKEQGVWALGPTSIEPAFSNLSRSYPDLLIWHASRLHDGTLAIGTYYNGILLISPDQRITVLNSQNGIPDGPIHQLFQDQERGLWIAGETYVSRFPFPLPLTYFNENNGLGGIVTAIAQYEGQLYVGTTRGLFSTSLGPQPDQLMFRQTNPAEILEVWDLYAGKEGLWIAASSGLFMINDNGTRQITDELCMAVRESAFDPDLVVAGLYEGVGICRKRNGTWTWDDYVPDFYNRTESLVETAPGIWWASYKELTRLQGVGITDTPSITTLDEQSGWNEDLRIMDLSFENGRLTTGSDKGRYLINQELGLMQADSAWNRALPTGQQQSHWVTPSTSGGYWVYNGGFVGKMEQKGNTRYQWANQLLSGLQSDVWTLYEDSDGLLWMGINDGVLCYDPEKNQLPTFPFSAYFRDIRLQGDSLVPVLQTAEELPQFRHGQSDLVFGYSAIGFTFPDQLEFQFMLEGYDESWSEWSRQTDPEKYTQLREGRYTFRVRAKDLYGNLSREARYSFLILPPWYRTWWALLLYLTVIGLIVAALVRYQTRAQQKRLDAKERELALERQTTDRLRAIDKLKDQFLANTSHELKTPLNGIIGLAESMYLDEKKEQDKYNLGLIVSSGKRLQSLVNDILDFSMLRSHEIKLQKKQVDLKGIADVVVHLQATLLRRKPVTLSNLIPEDFPMVEADEARITQVFHNLIGNAIKFTHKGSIEIHGTVNQEEVEISVTDTGIGIPESKFETIFQAFEQADGSIQRQYSGTGLGLPISRQLVELHGGRLTLSSQEGEGSTFRFSLPLSHAPEEALPTPALTAGITIPEPEQQEVSTMGKDAPHPNAGLANQQVKILLVDDEVINLEVMKAHLSDPDIQLLQANNGPEAIDLLEQHPDIDLMILDVMMPGMSGFEVCRIIRQQFLPSELPIIIVTAKNQIEDLVQAFSFGANDYIAKPFSRAEFLSRVKTQLYLQTIHQATRRFVPTEFLKALGYEAITETQYGDQVECIGTVCFSDIRNYTHIAEQLSPEETFLFLNAYYSRMGPVIRKHQGFINQFIGDGIMALFLESPDDALRAAIGMQEALQAYNKDREKRGFMPIGMGIGLHTGQLMMGIIGDGIRMDAGLVADTVNTASRLEGLTKRLGVGILISEEGYQALVSPESFRVRFLCRVAVKGKEQLTSLYECLDSYPTDLRTQRIQSAPALVEAFELVEKQEFAEAIQIYGTLIKEYPQDQAIRFLLAETQQAQIYAKKEGWNKALNIRSK